MNKQAYFKLMGLNKKAQNQRMPNFYQTGIPQTYTQQNIFLRQGTKDNPLPLLAQQQIANKISKKWRNRVSLGHQFKRLLGLTDDNDKWTYHQPQTAGTLFNPSKYPVYDIKYGVPFMDDVRNWWRFLTKGK